MRPVVRFAHLVREILFGAALLRSIQLCQRMSKSHFINNGNAQCTRLFRFPRLRVHIRGNKNHRSLDDSTNVETSSTCACFPDLSRGCHSPGKSHAITGAKLQFSCRSDQIFHTLTLDVELSGDMDKPAALLLSYDAIGPGLHNELLQVLLVQQIDIICAQAMLSGNTVQLGQLSHVQSPIDHRLDQEGNVLVRGRITSSRHVLRECL